MALPARLVNCSLVFLLVIRCTRAPGQTGPGSSEPCQPHRPGSHDSFAPEIITASAIIRSLSELILLCKRMPNYEHAGRVRFVPRMRVLVYMYLYIRSSCELCVPAVGPRERSFGAGDDRTFSRDLRSGNLSSSLFGRIWSRFLYSQFLYRYDPRVR